MRNLSETAFDRKVGTGAKTGPAYGLSATAATSADVASYVSEMAAQLELMAMGAKLDLLAYFLRMAQLEARSSLRASQTPSSKKAPVADAAGYRMGDE